MDADGAAADLAAVEHEIVGPGQGFARGGLDGSHLAGLGRGEGMVAGHPAFGLGVVFQQREIRDPDRGEAAFGDQVEAFAELQAQIAQGVVDHVGRAGLEKDNVADFKTERRRSGPGALRRLKTWQRATAIRLP